MASPFIRRPDKGLGPSNTRVIANYLPLTSFFSGNVFHYDVSTEPETRKNLFKKLWGELIVEQKNLLKSIAFDGAKNIYTTVKFKEDKMSFKMPLGKKKESQGTGKNLKEPQKVVVINIKFVNTINMAPLQEYVLGRGPYNNDVILANNVLEVVVRQDPAQTHLSIGPKFFKKDDVKGVCSLSGGLVLKRGVYISARPTAGCMALNVSTVHAAFHREIPVINYIAEVFCPRDDFVNQKIQEITQRGLNDFQRRKIEKMLKKITIFTTHRKGTPQTHSIYGLSHVPLASISFELDEKVDSNNKKADAPKKITVVEYFKKTYGIALSATKLPAINVGDSKRPVYLPMELCTIQGNQRYSKQLDDNQVASIIRVTAKPPAELLNITTGLIKNMLSFVNPTNTIFKIKVDGNFMSVPAHILPATCLLYTGTQMMTIQWRDSSRCKFIASKSLGEFGIISLARQCNTKEIGDDILTACRMRGLQASGFKNIDYSRLNDAPAVVIGSAIQELSKHLRNKPQMVFFILEDKDVSLYAAIKSACDCRFGIASQVVLRKKAEKRQPTYFANLSLKINVKLGGTNWTLSKMPKFFEKSAIILGADVTHPSPGSMEPSIAAVVASCDKTATRYISDARVQGSRIETILDINEITKNLFENYRKKTNGYPVHCLFYRDGVSEGQFNMAIDEANAIKQAARALKINGFKLTYVVVQKRHHTRFAPLPQGSPPTDKSGNFPAGMIVDSVITSPVFFDFYLQSQKGLQGTCRPAHYQVLVDDYGFKSAELYELTFQMCALYARAPTTVKVPAPVYYAHHLCYRTRYRVPETDGSVVSRMSGDIEVPLPVLYKLSPEVQDAMYYI